MKISLFFFTFLLTSCIDLPSFDYCDVPEGNYTNRIDFGVYKLAKALPCQYDSVAKDSMCIEVFVHFKEDSTYSITEILNHENKLDTFGIRKGRFFIERTANKDTAKAINRIFYNLSFQRDTIENLNLDLIPKIEQFEISPLDTSSYYLRNYLWRYSFETATNVIIDYSDNTLRLGRIYSDSFLVYCGTEELGLKATTVLQLQ